MTHHVTLLQKFFRCVQAMEFKACRIQCKKSLVRSLGNCQVEFRDQESTYLGGPRYLKCLQLFYAYYIIGANLLDFRFGTEFFTIFLAPKFIKDSVPFVKDSVPFIKNSVPFIKVSVPFIKNSVPKFWHRNCIPPNQNPQRYQYRNR